MAFIFGADPNNRFSSKLKHVLQWPLHEIFFYTACLAGTLQFIIFKWLYPYANFVSDDSYAYLKEASSNVDISFYPIGYSKFLRLFSAFTRSDTALVAFQYLAVQTACYWFLVTIFEIYQPSKLAKWVIFLFIFFNPTTLYLCNYILSDSLFLALSITWFTMLLRIVLTPTSRLIYWQSIVLFIAFTIRYNALYYPFIAGATLFFVHIPLQKKLTSISISLLLICVFVVYTSNQYHRLTGINQFSPFSGWQIANNALYAYRYTDKRHLQRTPLHLQSLDNVVRHYFDTSRNLRTHPYELLVASTVYMWDPRSPLYKYMQLQNMDDTARAHKFKNWASVAPLYAEYGAYLISQYPDDYFKHFVVPNVLKYYTPPVEFLGEYNMGSDTIRSLAKDWFRYRSNTVRSTFKDPTIYILNFMPITAAFLNLFFLLGVISVYWLTKTSGGEAARRVLLLTLILWAVNFGFSVFASPITLRYQMFGIVVFSTFALVSIDSIHKIAFSK